jgi:hypothetical protein
MKQTKLTNAGGPPIPGRINPFDMPDDFFRIRLVATLLETCGIFFNRGASGKKLDYFLSFLQVRTQHHNEMTRLIAFSTTFTLKTHFLWILNSLCRTSSL